jgi:hypothetical protein
MTMFSPANSGSVRIFVNASGAELVWTVQISGMPGNAEAHTHSAARQVRTDSGSGNPYDVARSRWERANQDSYGPQPGDEAAGT